MLRQCHPNQIERKFRLGRNAGPFTQNGKWTGSVFLGYREDATADLSDLLRYLR